MREKSNIQRTERERYLYYCFLAGCNTVEALECATLHPAQLLGLSDHKGTLSYESDADFVMLDEQLNVLSTHIAGEVVWSKV